MTIIIPILEIRKPKFGKLNNIVTVKIVNFSTDGKGSNLLPSLLSLPGFSQARMKPWEAVFEYMQHSDLQNV